MEERRGGGRRGDEKRRRERRAEEFEEGERRRWRKMGQKGEREGGAGEERHNVYDCSFDWNVHISQVVALSPYLFNVVCVLVDRCPNGNASLNHQLIKDVDSISTLRSRHTRCYISGSVRHTSIPN